MPSETEPDWAELLNAYYSNGGWMWRSTKDGESFPKLPQENNLHTYDYGEENHGKLYRAHNTLTRTGLVEQVEFSDIGPQQASPQEHVLWSQLTEEGFNVAHERELSKSQQKANERVAFFTLILGFTAIIQAAIASLRLENSFNTLLFLVVILAICAVVFFDQILSR